MGKADWLIGLGILGAIVVGAYILIKKFPLSPTAILPKIDIGQAGVPTTITYREPTPQVPFPAKTGPLPLQAMEPTYVYTGPEILKPAVWLRDILGIPKPTVYYPTLKTGVTKPAVGYKGYWKYILSITPSVVKPTEKEMAQRMYTGTMRERMLLR